MAEYLSILVSRFDDLKWLYGIQILGVAERTIVFQYTNDMILFLGRLKRCEVAPLAVYFLDCLWLCINLQKSSLIGVRMKFEGVQHIVS